ncbi:MAG TPA: DUF3147 family protein [Ktedonobacteraceae bacterium]|jgi:hypothetical protein
MWKLNLSQLRGIHLRDYLVRFLFGGIISALAALIAQWTTGRIGGIFTAFPAILLASLTLINEEDGRRAAVLDAQGAVLGAVALVLASFVISITLGIFSGVVALLLGLGVWLVCSLIVYILSVKLGWLQLEQKE